MADILEREASRFLGRSTIPAAGKFFTPAEMSRSFTVTERYQQALRDLERTKAVNQQEAQIQDFVLERRQRELDALRTGSELQNFDRDQQLEDLAAQQRKTLLEESIRTAPERAELDSLQRGVSRNQLVETREAQTVKPFILQGLKNADLFSPDFESTISSAAVYANEDPDIAEAIDSVTRRRNAGLQAMGAIEQGLTLLPEDQRDAVRATARARANQGDLAGLQQMVVAFGGAEARREQEREIRQQTQEFKQELRKSVPFSFSGKLNSMFNRVQQGDQQSVMGALKDARDISQGMVTAAQKALAKSATLGAFSKAETDVVMRDIQTLGREAFAEKYFAAQATSASGDLAAVYANRLGEEIDRPGTGEAPDQSPLALSFQSKQREALLSLYDKVHQVLQAPEMLVEQRMARQPLREAAAPTRRTPSRVDDIFEEASQ